MDLSERTNKDQVTKFKYVHLGFLQYHGCIVASKNCDIIPDPLLREPL